MRILIGFLFILTACSSAPSEPEKKPEAPKGTIDSIMFEHQDQFAQCYESNIGKKGKEGKVVVKFTYNSAGKVTKARVASSALKNKKVETCVLAEIRRIDFPVIVEGGTKDVTYPFTFKKRFYHDEVSE